MLRHLTLVGPESRGELLWDDEAGTFQGTDAQLIDQVADQPVVDVSYPTPDGVPRTSAEALIVLLLMLGWGCPPELAEEARRLRSRATPMPPDCIA